MHKWKNNALNLAQNGIMVDKPNVSENKKVKNDGTCKLNLTKLKAIIDYG